MRSVILAATGGVMILTGAVFLPTPLPVGLPLIIFGAFLVAQISPRARRMIGWLRGRFPRLESALSRRRTALPRGLRYFLGLTRPAVGQRPARTPPPDARRAAPIRRGKKDSSPGL